MNPFWIEMSVRGRVTTIATAITTSEINRSVHETRLKKNHQTRIRSEKISPPSVPSKAMLIPKISAPGATAGRMDLNNTSRTAPTIPGQRRSGFVAIELLLLGMLLLRSQRLQDIDAGGSDRRQQ